MRRIITAREQVEMLSPWKTAAPEDAHDPGRRYRAPKRMPNGKWYHVSPQKLPVGTVLTPGGGPSQWDTLYDEDGGRLAPRRKWVWMEQDLDRASRWKYDDDNIYEIEPSEGPYPWNGVQKGEGWVAPSARVVRVVPRSELSITASVEDDIMDLLGVPVKPYNPATAPPPAPRRDPYEEMRDIYKDRPQGKIKYDLMIPTDILDHYREHNRDYDDKLEGVIREQGIREPVHISTNGTHAILNEGNHRLDIAQKLGIPEIPARVFVDDNIIRGDNRYGKPPVPLEPFLKKFIDTNRDRLESFWG